MFYEEENWRLLNLKEAQSIYVRNTERRYNLIKRKLHMASLSPFWLSLYYIMYYIMSFMQHYSRHFFIKYIFEQEEHQRAWLCFA